MAEIAPKPLAPKPVEAAPEMSPPLSEAPGTQVEPTEKLQEHTNGSGSAAENGDVPTAEDTTKSTIEEKSKSDEAMSKTPETAPKDTKASDSDDDSREQNRPSSADRKRWRENVKSDYSLLPESADPEEICKQVEFYFSDSNLPQDTYLYNLVGGSANNPVPIKVIHSFKRMAHFQPYSAVVAALKNSTVLDMVNGEEIKRKIPIIERDETMSHSQYVKVYEDRTQSRSIYAKGFGEEGKRTQFEIEDFFLPYGPVNSVRLRREQNTKVFKGSVFVEFDRDETQRLFLELEPKPKWKGEELLIMSKKAYVDMKTELIRTGKLKPNPPVGDRQRGGRRGNDRRDGHDRRDGRGDKRGGRGDRRGDRRGGRGGGRDGGRDGGNRGAPTCYGCGQEGHKKNDCPTKDDEGNAVRGRKGKGKGEEKMGDKDAAPGAQKPVTVKEQPAAESKKRAREDDGETNGSEKKKAKSEEPVAVDKVPATASKKRSREDGEEADCAEKKKAKADSSG